MNTKVWRRSDLKERGKEAFKKSYWWCVLAALILAIVTSGGSSAGSSSGRNAAKKNTSYNTGSSSAYDINELKKLLEEAGDEGLSSEDIQYMMSQAGSSSSSVARSAASASVVAGIAIFVLIIFVVVFAIAIVLKVFLLNPVQVGGMKFFVDNALTPQKGIGSIGVAFQSGNYKNIVLGMFMMNLKIFLWSLLFIIPGIIKAYEYRMVPYILGENPDMSYTDALERSSRMMDGQKWNAFVLDLSFIGWNILSAFTLGILGIFWVNPYFYATQAELYLELSDEGVRPSAEDPYLIGTQY